MRAPKRSSPAGKAAEKSSAGALVLVAEIGAPHGVRGLMRLKVHAESPEALWRYPLQDGAGRSFSLRHLQQGPKGPVAGFAGINDRDAAASLRNRKLYTPRAALPELADEDDFYIADLIGLEVRHVDGTPVGRVRTVQNFGAGDLIDVVTPEGRSDYLPFTRAFVPEVRPGEGLMLIDPPLGFLQPAGPPGKGEDGEEE